MHSLILMFFASTILIGCTRDEDARKDQTPLENEAVTLQPHKVYPFEPSPEKFQEYMNSRTWRGGSTRVTFMYLQDCKEITEYRIQLQPRSRAYHELKYSGSYGYECNDGFARVTDPTGTDTCEASVVYKPVIDNTLYYQEYEIWSMKNLKPREYPNRWLDALPDPGGTFRKYDPDIDKLIKADYQERLSHWESKLNEKFQKILPHIERWEYSYSVYGCGHQGSHGSYLPESYGGTIGRRSNPQ